MPLDRVVAKSIWDGKVPVVLTLAQTDYASFKQADPLFLMLPRCSYFPLHIDERIRQHFREFSAKGADTDEYWLETNDVPLKWHVPIGVHFDLHVKQTHLPWPISVHFRNFPADKLVRLSTSSSTPSSTPSSAAAAAAADGGEAVQNHFFSMIKQTDYAKNGSTKKMMSLSKNDQIQLWDGFKTQQFDKFWSVNSQLISDGTTPFKGLPVRIYLESGTTLQDVIPPQTLTGRPTQLIDVLRKCIPVLFPSAPGAPALFPVPVKKSSKEAENENEEGASAGEGKDAASAPSPGIALPAQQQQQPQPEILSANVVEGPPVDVLVHGVKPAYQTPLIWLSDNLSHPDNFVHIIVRRLM